MIGLGLDILIIAFLLFLFQGGEAVEWSHIALVGVGIGAANFVLILALGWYGLLPIIVVDGVILAVFCSFTVVQAAISAIVLVGCKFGLAMLLS